MRTINVKKILSIFWTFLQISPLTFGGGYAMIPAIEREVLTSKKWMSEEEMSEVLAIASAAPGGVGVNVSAMVGYRITGIWGAIAAVIGITLPTFFIVILLSIVYSYLQDYPKMQAIMKGIHAGIVGLIVAAAYRMAKSSIIDKLTLLAAVCTVIVLIVVPIHPIFVIIFGLVLGVAVVFLKERLGMPSPLERSEAKVHGANRYASSDYFMADGI
ncbi:chromate transporter [Paenibacillus sp. N3.4]|uniref:chromate transporter n=1 Tax=Paenibacillus sp. N3.4 TaxID=2603222 RepID=UPI0011CBB0E1|nr:chromate transporter [Paenibacillus sp. N3.4]TXK83719.1 chromate transporter [Paenibacillus sp. N3.4]